MARKQVVEIVCDRCNKTEYLPPDKVREDTDFDGTFLGQKVVFHDLCSRCEQAVGNYFGSVIKAKKEEASEEASSDAGLGGESPRAPTPPGARSGDGRGTDPSTPSRRPTT